MLGPTNEKNSFLSGLSAAEYAPLRNYLAPVELLVGQYLHYLGATIDAVIFPHSGLIALRMPLRDDFGAGALIGRDGIVGALGAVAGTPAESDALVHIAGHASWLPAAVFRQLLGESPSLLRRVVRYTQALVAQSQQNAVCSAVHPVEARICRLLLAVQVRCAGDRVPLIQRTLAQMLGIRRSTLSVAAGRLEALGMIRCHRGYIDIVSRDELERRSCQCHAMLNDYLIELLSASANTAPPAEVSRADRSSSGAVNTGEISLK